jgi:hypothetical protein
MDKIVVKGRKLTARDPAEKRSAIIMLHKSDAASTIHCNYTEPKKFPPLIVTEKDGSNRRLFELRVTQNMGLLDHIRVQREREGGAKWKLAFGNAETWKPVRSHFASRFHTNRSSCILHA